MTHILENIHQGELEKFSSLATQWWDPKGPCQPLHALLPLRLEFIAKRTHINHQRILDVGCGGGLLTEALAVRNAEVTGIDASPALIAVAEQHAHAHYLEINYRCMPLESFDVADAEKFDVITCLELLEHVPDPASLVHACARLIKPGGHIFFSTLNRTFKAYLQAVLGAEYLLRLLPMGTHEYDLFIRPSELDAFARDAGLTLNELTGVTYNPLTQTYHFCDTIDVNYLAHYQLPHQP